MPWRAGPRACIFILNGDPAAFAVAELAERLPPGQHLAGLHRAAGARRAAGAPAGGGRRSAVARLPALYPYHAARGGRAAALPGHAAALPGAGPGLARVYGAGRERHVFWQPGSHAHAAAGAEPGHGRRHAGRAARRGQRPPGWPRWPGTCTSTLPSGPATFPSWRGCGPPAGYGPRCCTPLACRPRARRACPSTPAPRPGRRPPSTRTPTCCATPPRP